MLRTQTYNSEADLSFKCPHGLLITKIGQRVTKNKKREKVRKRDWSKTGRLTATATKPGSEKGKKKTTVNISKNPIGVSLKEMKTKRQIR